MDVELLDNAGDPGVPPVVLEEISGQCKHQLSSNWLVAVHVCDKLHHWLQQFSFLRRVWCEISSFNGTNWPRPLFNLSLQWEVAKCWK